MGSNQSTQNKEVGESISNSPQFQTPPDKNQYWFLPETEYDDLPEWDNPTELPFELKTFNLEDLELAVDAPKDNPERSILVREIAQEIQSKGFFVLNFSPDLAELVQNFYRNNSEFFALPKEEKKKYEYDRHGEISGWQLIHFDNRNNRRDPEWRDVFYMSLSQLIRWPSAEYREVAEGLFRRQFGVAGRILQLIAQTLQCPPASLLRLVQAPNKEEVEKKEGEEEEEESVTWKDLDPVESVNSNMCGFRYMEGPGQQLQKEQKCMVHQDTGLVTLLPLSTLPGLQILYNQSRPATHSSPSSSSSVSSSSASCSSSQPMGHGRRTSLESFAAFMSQYSVSPNLSSTCSEGLDQRNQHEGYVWVPLEKYLPEGSMVVYFGRAMEHITHGQVPSLIHRVVRSPKAVRYSAPFELKPNPEAILRPLAAPLPEYGENSEWEKRLLGLQTKSFEQFQKGLQWESLQRQVIRADALGY